MFPLPNEEDEGDWKIVLPSLGGINEGRVTTARRYIQGLFGKILDNTTINDEIKSICALRDKALSHHIFAQQVGREKWIYFFKGNPLEPQYHIRDDEPSRFGMDVPVRFIFRVLECISAGEFDGYHFVKVWLEPEEFDLDPQVRQESQAMLEGVKVAKIAAMSKQQIKSLEEGKGIIELKFDQSLNKINELTSDKGEAEIIASARSLTSNEVPEAKGFHWPTAKQFFSWPQLALAIITYLVTPSIMTGLNVYYPEPNSVAFACAIAVFFLTPIVRKLIGK
jgi:hypothetical protein